MQYKKYNVSKPNIQRIDMNFSGKNMKKQELKNRWISILRAKSFEYETSARTKGELVSSPDIHDICNEIEAFFVGFER